MYVCVCKGITETSLRQAISQGISNSRQLAQQFQIGQECGQCCGQVKALLAESCRQCEKGH